MPALPKFAVYTPVFSEPATFMPVPVTTTTLPFPLTPKVTLPFSTGMFTLLVPLASFKETVLTPTLTTSSPVS